MSVNKFYKKVKFLHIVMDLDYKNIFRTWYVGICDDERLNEIPD